MRAITVVVFSLLLPRLLFSQTARDEHRIEVFKITSSDTHIDYDLLISIPKTLKPDLPVLYVLDPDYHYLQFLLSYDSLLHRGEVQDALIVGIGYGQNFLHREYGVLKDLTPTKMDPHEYNEDIAVIPKDSALRYTGGALAFTTFIKKEVFPFIDGKFTTGKERMVYGNGHAGLLLCYLLSQDASLFSGYIISNPSLWWDHEFVLRNAHLNIPEQIRVFLSVGGKQEKKVTGPFARFSGLLGGNQWIHVSFPNEDGYSSIPHGFREGTKLLFKKK